MASETVEFSSHVPKEDYDYFREQFPQYGATKWFITSALREFNERVRANPTLKEQVAYSIEHMLETSRLIKEATAGGETGK